MLWRKAGEGSWRFGPIREEILEEVEGRREEEWKEERERRGKWGGRLGEREGEERRRFRVSGVGEKVRGPRRVGSERSREAAEEGMGSRDLYSGEMSIAGGCG